MKGIFLIHIIQEDDYYYSYVREESGINFKRERATSSPIYALQLKILGIIAI